MFSVCPYLFILDLQFSMAFPKIPVFALPNFVLVYLAMQPSLEHQVVRFTTADSGSNNTMHTTKCFRMCCHCLTVHYSTSKVYIVKLKDVDLPHN